MIITHFPEAVMSGVIISASVFIVLKYLLSNEPDRREEFMKITDHNKEVAEYEGKKVQVTIAQIAEINRINNTLTGGEFYKIVRKKK